MTVPRINPRFFCHGQNHANQDPPISWYFQPPVHPAWRSMPRFWPPVGNKGGCNWARWCILSAVCCCTKAAFFPSSKSNMLLTVPALFAVKRSSYANLSALTLGHYGECTRTVVAWNALSSPRWFHFLVWGANLLLHSVPHFSRHAMGAKCNED